MVMEQRRNKGPRGALSRHHPRLPAHQPRQLSWPVRAPPREEHATLLLERPQQLVATCGLLPRSSGCEKTHACSASRRYCLSCALAR